MPNSALISTKSRSLSIGTYLQKYVMLSDKIALHAKANLYYAYEQDDLESAFYGLNPITYEPEQQNSYTNTSTSKEAGLAISPGITFFPSNKIGLGASFGELGYTYKALANENNSSDSESSISTFGLNLSSSSLVFSISYYISR